MGRKKKYKNAAEKQRAWRIRHGQPHKVPLALRRGQRTGASETELRERKEGESWDDYHKYIGKTVLLARRRQELAGGVVKEINDEEASTGAKRVATSYKEPTYGEEYYEKRLEYEKGLGVKKGRKLKKK